MVHEDDIFLVRKEEKSRTKCPVDEHGIVQPQWTIDEDGIPYCKCLDDYEKIIELDLKHKFPREFEEFLTCKRCSHYKNDDCFFPREEIDKIEYDRVHMRNNQRCVLCGNKIDRLWSILMSYYYKEKFGVNMPVICCTCYKALETNTYETNIKRRLLLFFISLLTSIYFIVAFLLTNIIWNYVGIILIVILLSFWGQISYRDLKSIYYLYQGRKYYRQIMNAKPASEDKPKSRREEKLDEEDVRPPPEGAYYSPGYTD